MASSDPYRARSSYRRNNSSTWRNNGFEAFSRSSRDEEDDEEALKWGALQKLPTYERLRKGILTNSHSKASEIDVSNLGLQERKELMERVGIDLPTIEVRYEHLKVEAETHVGSRALPTFINFSVNILESFLNYLHILPSRKKHISILQDVSGIVKPGRMTLLLGPPSSGKTTFLLALAGKLDPELELAGRVTYNGHDMNEFIPQRTAAYISQHDVHIGEMTVRETLAFSARCQGVGTRYVGSSIKKEFRDIEMEGGDLYRAASSIQRSGSSSLWMNSASEVFTRSTREEDDEEALKWAALEKLPTYNRLRKGILTSSSGKPNEVEISKLGFEERRNLMERLIKVAEEDNEKFLLKLKNRIDKVGLDIPTIEVRYENINIDAEAYVGSRALPSFFNFAFNIVESILNTLHIAPSKKKHISILHDVNGVIKPSRLALLLGPPSSGKTTFLLALAGKLDKELKLSGKVTYNGHGMNEFVPQRTAAYISQHDVHIGEMTVRETLAFSARCQGVGMRYEMLSELSRREKAAKIKPDPDVDIYMKVRKDLLCIMYLLECKKEMQCMDSNSVK
ncbi:hypothetical protein FEM48_Zijuj01G0299800 [Ziziphus jujuba var. spinosa]|uniref:ABC transporter domain-containing protein n=1 Tax=Ziziphus jujuba var. spinosa TaxID=714518 RepID=A0A978W5W0_ZIZJJ|nr:hypothetical protein FEM48_Zijuj01G0299800 [Ziziphus jujuba var. spinosa]